MKKNLVTIILCAMLCVGCLFIESNEFVALAFIGFVGGVVAVKDLNRIKKYERAKENSENVDYLLDCVEFGELEMMEG